MCQINLTAIFKFLVLSLAVLLTSASSTWAADEQSLREAINQAVRTHAPYVRIPPGEYRLRLDPSNSNSHLHFQAVSGLELDGTGVTLICTNIRQASCITLYACKNVTFKGFTIDTDPVAFTQGRIARIAKDHYALAIDPGYTGDPDDFRNARPMNVFTAKGLWKNGLDDIYVKRVERINPNELLVYPVGSVNKLVKEGESAVLPMSLSSCGIRAMFCENLVYDHITMYQAGTLAFLEDQGGGNTIMKNCLIDRKPNSGRLISTNADGFHSNGVRKGPTILNSRFRFIHDDGINVHGTYSRVINANGGKTLELIKTVSNDLAVGDTLLFVQKDTGRELGLARVLAVRTNKRLSAESGKQVLEAELDRAIPVASNDSYMNISACGAGYTIKGCEFGPLRGDGLDLKTLDGRILNNRVHDVGEHGIYLLGNSLGEGPFCQNILVEGNLISNIGTKNNFGCGVVSVCHHVANGQTLNNNIQILHNQITATRSNGILIGNSRDVRISDNQFSQIGTRSNQALQPVLVEFSQNVQMHETVAASTPLK